MSTQQKTNIWKPVEEQGYAAAMKGEKPFAPPHWENFDSTDALKSAQAFHAAWMRGYERGQGKKN